MTATVTVIGGGYAGITVAKPLDDVADVTLVEPRDTFVHNVAVLRAVTDPVWVERLFIPYEGLLARGRIRHDRAARMFGSAVELGSGDRVRSDFVMLATGSRGGVSYAPEAGVLGAEATVGIKGELFLDAYLDLLGAEAAR